MLPMLGAWKRFYDTGLANTLLSTKNTILSRNTVPETM